MKEIKIFFSTSQFLSLIPRTVFPGMAPRIVSSLIASLSSSGVRTRITLDPFLDGCLVVVTMNLFACSVFQ